MDVNRTLRHEVRNSMLSYLGAHKDSQSAFLATMSVLFLLGGRQGLPLEDRVDLVSSAHTTIRILAAERGFDVHLHQAHEGIHKIMEQMAEEIEQAQKDAQVLVKYEKEFNHSEG